MIPRNALKPESEHISSPFHHSFCSSSFVVVIEVVVLKLFSITIMMLHLKKVLSVVLLFTFKAVYSTQEGNENFYGVDCTLTASGFYGVKEFHVQFRQINYYYEIVYEVEDDIQEVLKELDLHIGQKVLDSTSLFEWCASRGAPVACSLQPF